jgi:uncharacterized protein YfiM (DUF2279 family)
MKSYHVIIALLVSVSGLAFGQKKTEVAVIDFQAQFYSRAHDATRGHAACWRFSARGFHHENRGLVKARLAFPRISWERGNIQGNTNIGDCRTKSSNIDLGLEYDDINRDFWLGRDKFFHWGASAVLAVSAYGVYHFIGRLSDNESMALASTATLTIGLAKEDFDTYVKKSFFSYKDLAADGVGIVTGLLFVGVCNQLF